MKRHVSDKGGSEFEPDKTKCPMCGVRFANLIKHLKRNRRCRAAVEAHFPVIINGSALDFLKGG